MNNNLPQIYENGIFNRIKRFWFKLFAKKEEGLIVRNLEIGRKATDFRNDLVELEVSKEIHDKEIKKSIIDIVKENPELLKTMSVEKLKKVILLYEEAIGETEEKIQRLKKKV